MKKRFLCFALAAMLIGGSVMTTTPVLAAGGGNTSVSLKKSVNDPYEGREYVAPMSYEKVGEITLPSGWSWATSSQELTEEFADSVVIWTKNDTELGRVTVKVKKGADIEAPTGAIEIETNSWNTFLNTITFHKLFKQTKTVTIEATDNVGIDSVKYYVASEGLTLDQVKALADEKWTTYEEAGFTLNPTKKYVVYALLTDTSNNQTYLSSDGLVFLAEKAPDIFVTEVGQNSFKINVNVSSDTLGVISEIGMKYKKAGDSSWTTKKAASITASNAFSITGLQAGEDYEVASYVTYTDGTTTQTAQTGYTLITTQPQALPQGSITVKVASELSESKDAVITVERGNNVIATRSVTQITANAAKSTEAFPNLSDGVYNVVLRTTDGKFVETQMITITNGSAGSVSFTVKEGELRSVVAVSNDAPAVAVSGLSDILNDTNIVPSSDMAKVQQGEISEEIKLAVTTASDTDATIQTQKQQIESIATSAGLTVETVLDMSLYKVQTDVNANTSNTTDIGKNNTTVLEIAVPYDTSKTDLSVIRYHGSSATKLTALPAKPNGSFTDGQFYVGNGYIYIYASGFSLYGIASNDTRAAGPAAPSGLTVTTPTSVGGTDGAIGGVDTTMEYSLDNGSNWSAVTGSSITGLSAGRVLVRVAATSTVKAGATAAVTVPAYKASSSGTSSSPSATVTTTTTATQTTGKNAGPAAPTGVYGVAPTKANGTDGKIRGVNATMEYTTDGYTWKPVIGTEITGLAGGTCAFVRVRETETADAGTIAVIVVPLYAKGTASVDGAKKETSADNEGSDVTEGIADDTEETTDSKKTGPAAPDTSKFSVTAPTSVDGTDGKIGGVDETMEYSTDGGKTWNDVTGEEIKNLSAGEVWIRVKETEDTAAGQVAKVTIPEYGDEADETTETMSVTESKSHAMLWVVLPICVIVILLILILLIKSKKDEDKDSF